MGVPIPAKSVLGSLASPQTTNRYAYCVNDPEAYTDPSGAIIDIAFDVASVAWDLWELWNDPSEENAGWLVVDIVCAAVPFLPAIGGMVKVGKWAERTWDARRAADKALEGERAAGRAEGCSDFFRWMDEAPGAGHNANNGFSNMLPDDNVLVVRGGVNGANPGRLIDSERTGITISSAPGRSESELLREIPTMSGKPYNVGYVTTRGELRRVGAEFLPDPINGFPSHGLVFPGQGGAPSIAGLWRRFSL